MDGPRDDHIKWSKSDKYHTTYMWNLKKKKKDTNELIYKPGTDSQRKKVMVTKGIAERWGER